MITGAEFSGEELLEVNDISDWLVNGVGGEPAKAVLMILDGIVRLWWVSP